MAYLLGIDAGTTALKIVLFREDGQLVAQSNEEYSLLMPGLDRVELDAQDYWKTCVRGIRRTLLDAAIDKTNIKALAVSSQGETFVPVDRNGTPLTNAIVESDSRSAKQAEAIRQRFGDEKIYEVTGQPYTFSTWVGTKILWLKENETAIYKNVHKFLLVEDYLIHKLTSEYVSEHSLVCSTLLFDIRNRRWWQDMLDFLDIGPEMLGHVMSSAEIVGHLTSNAADETGLSKNTLVVTGALDQAAGMIGSGNIKPGTVTESTGTVLAICAMVEQYGTDPQRRFPIHCHAVPESYYLLPWCRTAGVVLKWLRDNFCQVEMRAAQERRIDSYALLDSLAAGVPPGSDGLVVLPHFLGAIYPEFNSRAKGVFFGVTTHHTKAHFARAIMESVAYMLRRNLEVFAEKGIPTREIRSLGGASRSNLWCQIKADVTQTSLLLTENSEVAPALGAAVLAGVAAGVYSSLEDACGSVVRTKKSVQPSQSTAAVYNTRFQTYRRLYDSLEPLFGT